MVTALYVTEAPADIPVAIRAAKAELRTQIGDYQEVFAEIEAAMRREVAAIARLRERGEEVWPDAVHCVDPVTGQQGWGSVIYIPAAPYCPKNAAYAERCGRAFLAGETPDDFAPEHYEVGWAGRPGPPGLSPVGRRHLGLQAW
jgi:hypothetical protein